MTIRFRIQFNVGLLQIWLVIIFPKTKLRDFFGFHIPGFLIRGFTRSKNLGILLRFFLYISRPGNAVDIPRSAIQKLTNFLEEQYKTEGKSLMPCPSMWPKQFWSVQNGFGIMIKCFANKLLNLLTVAVFDWSVKLN